VITFQLVVHLACGYCSHARMREHIHTVPGDSAAVAARIADAAAQLEQRAVKNGWTASAWTDHLREWRCKKCTAALNARLRPSEEAHT
jgi:hypothetical protein